MKHVMMLALTAAALLTAPLGHAAPPPPPTDPHKPDLGAHYCPGGGTVDMMSPAEPSCDGVPYDDGSYWRAINRGAPGTAALVIVQCVKPPPPPGLFVPPQQGPVPAGPGGCSQ